MSLAPLAPFNWFVFARTTDLASRRKNVLPAARRKSDFPDYATIIANDRGSKPNLLLYSPNVLGPKQPWYGVA